MISGSIVNNKDLTLSYQPIILAVFTFQSDINPKPTLKVSTHPFDGISGPEFPGIGIMPAGAYLPRLAKRDADPLQYRSLLGIDRSARVTMHLLDADRWVWNNYVLTSSGVVKYGFRGASLQLALTMWEAGSQRFASDAWIQFTGTCDMETISEGGNMLIVTANNSHDTGAIKLPLEIIQMRCSAVFPNDLASRTASKSPGSIYYPCGYSPDVTDGYGNVGTPNQTDSNGNQITDSNGVYVRCNYIRADCMARLGNSSGTTVAPDGDLMHDESGRRTGNFTGVQWSPGTYYSIVSNYTSRDKFAAFSFLNSSVLGQFNNMVFGNQWVTPKIANIVESGNDTKCEVMVCSGDVTQYGIWKVVVNGIEIPQVWQDGYPAADPNLWWAFARDDAGNFHTGGRHGIAFRNLSGYNSPSHSALGDPFGSTCRIMCNFYKDIFTGFGTPTIQVLVAGPRIYEYDINGDATVSLTNNTNPAWVLMHILLKSNWTIGEIDIASFIDAASYCNELVTYTNNVGEEAQHVRFKCQFSLETRRTAADVLAGILRSFNGYMYFNQGGKLCLGISRTLADEQPSPITGSNYNSPVASVHADGSAGNGYVAYRFDETNIQMIHTNSGSKMDIVSEQNATIMTYNRVMLNFQNEDNQYVADSISITDRNAVARAGGALQPGGCVIDESLNAIGISNMDQAARIINVYIAERQYGNPARDPRGTYVFTIQSTFRCAHLRNGHIVQLKVPTVFPSYQTFRITRIAPGDNFETVKITVQWHDDMWYTDAYGQRPEAFYMNVSTNRPVRPPLPWQADYQTPDSAIFDPTEKNFGVAVISRILGDGSAMVKVQVKGKPPINDVKATCNPPLVPIQASVGSGGSIDGPATVYIQLCARDADGNLSAPSGTIAAATTAANQKITINNIAWDSNTEGYEVFAHWTPLGITHQVTGDGKPSSIELSSLTNATSYPPPDLAASTAYIQAKEVIHAGIIGTDIVSVDAENNQVLIAGGPLTNDLSDKGKKLILIGRPGLAGDDLPIVDFTILSNSGVNGTILTLDRSPDGILLPNDTVVVSANGAISDDRAIGDPDFVSVYSPSGLSTNDIGATVRIIAGTGRYQTNTIVGVSEDGTTYTLANKWTINPDSTSIFIVEASSWLSNSETAKVNCSDYADQVIGEIQFGNLVRSAILVQVLIGNADGTVYSPEYRSPFRVLWLYGVSGSIQQASAIWEW